MRGWWRGAWAVARTTWTGGLWRSGWVAATAAALVGLCAGLPLALGGGDGRERLRLYLTYATGAAGFGLSVFALWAGCAGVSGEAEKGTLGGLLATPLGRGAAWCGKWAAATGASWALLAAVAAAVGATGWSLGRGGAGEGLRVAYETRRAALPDVSEEVAWQMALWRARGGSRAGEAAASAAGEGFRRAALAERCRLAGGKSAEWRFDASGAADGEALALSWQCHAGVPGNWNVRIGIDAGEGRTAELEGPAGARRETRLDWAGGGELVLAARLAGDEGADFWFDPEDGMLLRVPKGGAWGNAAKAVASWAGRLALLAAVGTTLGTLFSMPVASFLAVALLALVQCGDLLEEASGADRDAFVRSLTAVMGGGGHGHGGEEAASPPGPWAERGAAAVYYLYKGTGWALKPLTGDHSARQLCEGEWIPPGETARGLGWRLAALPALLGALGTWVLRRREWGNWGGARS